MAAAVGDARDLERVRKRMETATALRVARAALMLSSALFVPVQAAGAQVQRVVALDGLIGLGYGVGGGATYTERQQVAAEVLGTVRAAPRAGHSFVVGASVGWMGRYGDQACAVPCPVALPRTRHRALHIGWEVLQPNGSSLRVLVGPRWDAHAFHVEGARRGWHLRGDVGTRSVGPVTLVGHLGAHTATSGPEGVWGWVGGIGVRLR